jgi:hypothetical protein
MQLTTLASSFESANQLLVTTSIQHRQLRSFQKKSKLLGKYPKSLSRTPQTRWASTYEMLDRINQSKMYLKVSEIKGELESE